MCLTYLKKNKNSPLQFTSDPLPEQVIEDSSKQVEDSVRGLYKAIHQLSEIDRAIILLYLERQSNQDIADILGLSANNIGVRVLRIKQRLNKLLDYGESSDE